MSNRIYVAIDLNNAESMSAFDQIIGYSVIKKELERTADALKNRDVYAALGVSTPNGLLLHGEPGVGKSLMAGCLIAESGRNVLTLRRDEPDGDFVRAIKETFEKAVESAPSIVFLDDMDKFAKVEDDCSNQEEFVAVQAAIDKVKGSDVFVLATANSLRVLPESLIRAGRFDRVLRVDAPSEKEAPEIIEHFLADKQLSGPIDVKVIARLLSGRSCAELETSMNSAGLLAAYDRCPAITMQHIIMGCVNTIHGISSDHIIPNRSDDPLDPNSDAARTACHEAGHAVVSEVLEPGSVTLACIHELQNSSKGFVTVDQPIDTRIEKLLEDVVQSVAGHAALEMHFGILDAGASDDLSHARNHLHDIVCSNDYIGCEMLGSPYEDSQNLLGRQELAIAYEMTRCINRARQILAENRPFFEAMIAALLKKGLLTGEDIQEIRGRCA